MLAPVGSSEAPCHLVMKDIEQSTVSSKILHINIMKENGSLDYSIFSSSLCIGTIDMGIHTMRFDLGVNVHGNLVTFRVFLPDSTELCSGSP